MPTRKSGSPELGFTLIELLVVVAIIALLISILLPSLKRAKDQAKQVVCATHQRELYTASTEYAADNRDYYARGIQGLHTIEYNIFSSSILPYVGYDGRGRLWAGQGYSNPNWTWKDIVKRLNKIMLDFDVFHCTGFPVAFYDDPSDKRFSYAADVDEELYGPSLINPMHYIASAFPMPYPQYSVNQDASNLCWDEDAAQVAHGSGASDPYHYAEASTLESFPVECQPSTKIYVTGVDKTVPWVKQNKNGGLFSGQRFNTMFHTSHLSFSSHPRMGEDQRHPGGINNMFFDGHVKAFDTHKMDPGCEFELDERLSLFTIMHDDWEPGGAP